MEKTDGYFVTRGMKRERFVFAVTDPRTGRFQGFLNTTSLKKDAIRKRIVTVNPSFKKLGIPFKYEFK